MTPMLPKHAFSMETFDQTTLKPVTGSGPYRIAQVDSRPNGSSSSATPTIGARTFRRSAVSTITTASPSTTSSTPTRSSRHSRRGSARSRRRADPVKRVRDFDFPAVKDGKVVARDVQERPAAGRHGLPVQHTPAEIRRRARAAGAGTALRFRMGEQEHVRRPVRAHRELLAEFRTLGARAGRRARRRRPCWRPIPKRYFPKSWTAPIARRDGRLRPRSRPAEGGFRAAEGGRLHAEGRQAARSDRDNPSASRS